MIRDIQKEYYAFQAMKQRCNNPKCTKYKNHGGRGIRVLYLDVYDFIADVGMAPTPKHTVDRIDNNGNYEKGNCRWATYAEQNRNLRTNHLVTISGVTKCAQDWAKSIPVNFNTFIKRINKWPEEEWLTPTKPHKGYSVDFPKSEQKFRARVLKKHTSDRQKEKCVGYFHDYESAETACQEYLQKNPTWYL
jgi:hypothetical protein